MHSRRDFLKTAVLGTTALSVVGARAETQPALAAPAAPSGSGPMLGSTSYNFRKFSLDQALAMTHRLGLTRLSVKDFHLPLNSTAEQFAAAHAKAAAQGVELYCCGVIYMKTAAEVDQAFRYAKAGGFGMMNAAPNVEFLPQVDRLVKETGIRVAVHNHGPDNPLYSSPLDAYESIRRLDPRIGLCLDIGHTQRYGLDPIKVFETVAERTYDIHIKDVTASTKAGTTAEIGRGVIDMAGFLRAVVAKKYAHTLDFEFEKDAEDPLPGLAESIGYVRGMLKLLAS